MGDTEVSSTANIQPVFVSSLDPTLSQTRVRHMSDQRRAAQKTNLAMIAEVGSLSNVLHIGSFQTASVRRRDLLRP